MPNQQAGGDDGKKKLLKATREKKSLDMNQIQKVKNVFFFWVKPNSMMEL